MAIPKDTLADCRCGNFEAETVLFSPVDVAEGVTNAHGLRKQDVLVLLEEERQKNVLLTCKLELIESQLRGVLRALEESRSAL
jgi:hypothetical protein